MAIAVQMIVRAPSTHLQAAVDSVRSLASAVLVADAGVGLRTIRGCTVLAVDPSTTNDQLRHRLAQAAPCPVQFMLHPWERLLSGHDRLLSGAGALRLTVVQGTLLTREVRTWSRDEVTHKVCHPAYEHVEAPGAINAPDVVIASAGRNDHRESLDLLAGWRERRPLDPVPLYYTALARMALGDYVAAANASEQFSFVRRGREQSDVLNRYYYAMIQAYHLGNVRRALQSLNLCIEARPLMAEFWCLLGDIHYTLLNAPDKARHFYENAIVLGNRRLADDLWPMDVSKYGDHPRWMIQECDRLARSIDVFVAPSSSRCRNRGS